MADTTTKERMDNDADNNKMYSWKALVKES